MKCTILSFIFAVLAISLHAQGIQLKDQEPFPEIPIQNLINSPQKSIFINNTKDPIVYILNFWGTWCSPCIPEMDALAKLQQVNSGIRVIGISDEDPLRLHNYLKKKPSSLWLSSDTTYLLYKMMALSYVGQSAIVHHGKIVAMVRTDSINQAMVQKLIKGEKVRSSAEIKQSPVNNASDLFAVDSTLSENFTLRGYMIGQQSMGKHYSKSGPYKGRRLSFVNSCMSSMYMEAFSIKTPVQLIYEGIAEKDVCDFDLKSTLYCLDLLVKPAESDRLNEILQERLNQFLPVKARIEYRKMQVYVIKNKNFNLLESIKTESRYGFSGKGYDGESVTLTEFADNYLSNEMELPVVDGTGLSKKYDLKTSVEVRTREGVLKSIENLGLELTKEEQKMKVLILYKP